eukprot:g15260.t1
MASTALDFREMMRRERERAMKERMAAAAASMSAKRTRYLSHRRTPLDLKRNHRVAPSQGDNQGIDGIHYVPGFVTKEEGRLLESAACGGDGGADGDGGPEWKELYKRRLQIHGGTPHPSGMVEEELPPFLRELCDALVEAGVFPESSPPNHVLLNEYSSGQGIGPHKDGPLYEGRVAILSLGKEASLDFWGSLEDAKADCAAIAAAAAAPGSDAGAPDSSLAGSDAPGPPDGTPAEHVGFGATGADECRGQRKTAARRALASVRCEDCSLVVFEGAAYYDAWHGIASTAGDSSTTGGGAPATGQTAAAAAANGRDGNRSGPASSGAAGPGAPAATPSYSSSGDVRGGANGAGGKRLSFTIRRVARVAPADSVIEHPEARSEMERRRRGFERSVTETRVAAAPRDR